MTTESLASWLSVPKPSLTPRVRLVCLPYAGGTAAIYRPWAEVLPPDIELNAIQLPGREWRVKEAPIDRMDALVAMLVQVLEPRLDVPIALYGHSLGALVSFELARALRRELSVDPVHLFVAAHRAPQLPNEDPPIHEASDEAFIDGLRQLRGTPEEVLSNRELMELLLPILRADFAIAARYRYTDEPPLTAPISAFGGLGDVVADTSKLAAWAAQTTGRFRLRMMPGGHFFINEARDLLLRAVFQDLMAVKAS